MTLRRILRLLASALILASLVSAVLAPPDPLTQLYYVAGFVVVAVPVVVLYVGYTEE